MGWWQRLFGGQGEGKPPRLTEEERIEKDLTAEPISRTRMDLLWLSESSIRLIETSVRAGRQDVHAVAGSAAGAGIGDVTLEDIAWVDEVQAVADRASAAAGRREFRRAIRLYREALALAPGCDQWLNSIGSCYAMLGKAAIGIRYVERAYEVTAQKTRIGANLQAVQAMR
jgi:tetratricopeptide (TPR) repeat protein